MLFSECVCDICVHMLCVYATWYVNDGPIYLFMKMCFCISLNKILLF
jgi:hypothetical protein